MAKRLCEKHRAWEKTGESLEKTGESLEKADEMRTSLTSHRLAARIKATDFSSQPCSAIDSSKKNTAAM